MWDLLCRDSNGKIDISQAWSHVLGLPNGENVTDVGPNGIEGEEVYVDDTQV
jgi:hypothetical protein